MPETSPSTTAQSSGRDSEQTDCMSKIRAHLSPVKEIKQEKKAVSVAKLVQKAI